MTLSASNFPPIKPPEVKYELRFGYRDEETGDWMTIDLDEKQQEFFGKIIESITKAGEDSVKFTRQGEILEITEKGIYRKGKERWINLLEKASPESKKRLAKILQVSTQKLREIGTTATHKGKNLTEESKDFIEEVISKPGFFARAPDVFIQVRVASSKKRSLVAASHFDLVSIQQKGETFFTKGVTEHREFVNTLLNASQKGLLPEYRSELKRKGFSDAQIDRMFSYFTHLATKASEAQSVLDEVEKSFSENKWAEGMARLASWTKTEFPIYQRALQSAMVYQEWAILRFPEFPQSFLIHANDVTFFEHLYKAVVSTVQERLENSEADWEINFKKLNEAHWNEHSKILDEVWQTEWRFFDKVQQFAKLMETHRDRFYYFLEKKGFSKEEIANLFGYFPKAAKEMEPFESKLKKVKELVDQKKIREAQEEYAKLMSTEYASYVNIMKPGALAMKAAIISDNRMRVLNKTFENFLKSVGTLPFEPTSLIIQFVQRPPRHILLWKDAIKKYPYPSEVSQFSTAGEKISEGGAVINELVRSYETLTLRDLKASTELLNPVLVKDEDFKKNVLQRIPWNEKQIKEFYDAVNAYAEVIQPLQEARQALKNEPTNIDLKNEVKKRANTAQLRLGELSEKIGSLGGSKVVENVRDRLEEFRDALQNRLSLAEAMQKQGVTKDAVAFFPDSPDKKALEKLFTADGMKEQRNLLRVLNNITAFSNYRAKGDFLNDFYASLHFIDNIVSETLLHPALSSSREWKDRLKEGNWTDAKTKALNSVFEPFIRETEALKDLQMQSQNHPENLKLKQNLRAMALEKSGKLSQMQEQIKKLGGKKGLRSLSEAIEKHRQWASFHFETTKEPHERELFKKQLKLLEEAARFGKEIEESSLFLSDLYTSLHLREDPITAMIPVVRQKNINIDSFLKKHGWSLPDLKKLDEFFLAFFKETDDLAEAKMIYDQDPLNEKGRAELLSAVNARAPAIKKLLKKLNGLGGESRLAELATALEEYKNALSVDLHKLAMAIKVAESADKMHLLSSQIEGLKKEMAEVDLALKRLNKVDFKAEFFDRVPFIKALYQAFDLKLE